MSNMSITIFYNNSILSYLYYIDNFFVCMVQISTHDSFNFSSSVPYEQLFLCMVQISTYDSFNSSSSVPYEQFFVCMVQISTHDSFNSSLSVPYEQLFLCMVQIPHLSTKIFHTNSLLPRNHVHMGQICKKLNNNKLRIYLISHTTIFVCGKYVKV